MEEVAGGVQGREDWWEEGVWPERSASGLEPERGFFLEGGGSLSNSKEGWNFDELVCVLL